MEKKEMSFKDKFQAAGEELEKEIKDGGAMILIAVDGGEEFIYANILGESRKLAAMLSYEALRSHGFEEIITNSIKAIERHKEINKK